MLAKLKATFKPTTRIDGAIPHHDRRGRETRVTRAEISALFSHELGYARPRGGRTA